MANSVAVLYAGSLTRLMDTTIGPAFERATGIAYTGEDGLGGAVALAEAILDGRRTPDVFLPADGAQVSRLIMPPAANFATWFVPFARTAKVLAYSPRSRFFDDFERAKRGEVAWFEVLQRPGLRLGSLGSGLDPGGYTALFTLQLAETLLRRAWAQTASAGRPTAIRTRCRPSTSCGAGSKPASWMRRWPTATGWSIATCPISSCRAKSI